MVLFPGEHGCHAHGPLDLCPETPLLGDVSSCDCCCVIRARILASGRKREEGGRSQSRPPQGPMRRICTTISTHSGPEARLHSERETGGAPHRTQDIPSKCEPRSNHPGSCATASRHSREKGATCPLHHHGVRTAPAPAGHSPVLTGNPFPA